MLKPNRDLLGGVLLVLFGIAYAGQALLHYPIGNIQKAGPGFFPLCLGIILSILGALIVVPAIGRESRFPRILVRAPLAILVSLGVFALLARPLGLIPAVVVANAAANLAQPPFRPLLTLTSSLVLALGAYLIFGVTLGISAPMFAWRW